MAPSPAAADTLTPDPPDTSGIRRIGKGIKEFGGESILVLDYGKEGDAASSFRASTVTGLSFRYFVVDNLNLALNASYFFKGDGTIAQRAYIESLSAADYDRVIQYTGAEGKQFRAPLGPLLEHVANHATHHRSEIATMLTMVSGSPPDTGLATYLLAMTNQLR